MTRIDNSVKDEYYTQLNNKRFPLAACNVTASIMFMRSNRIPYSIPTQEQDEDYLMWMLRQPEAYQKLEELTPWFVDKKQAPVTDWTDPKQIDRRYACPPSEVWQMLVWGINKLAGRMVADLRFDLRLNEFLFELVRGRTMVVGGKFTKSGHFVNAVGLITAQDDIIAAKTPNEIRQPEVTHVIVDDPYGNYLTGYTDHDGNSTEIPIEQFLDVVAVFRNPAYGRTFKIYAITKI
jgi:hypothetical protein